MFEKSFYKKLKPDERVVRILRQCYLVYIGHYIIAFVFIILGFFLLYPLIRWSWWGLLIICALIMAGLFYGLRTFFIWNFNVFLITNKRIIDFDQKGLFHKNVTETTFDNIQDISYNKQGVFPTMFKYGNIVVKTANVDSNIEIINVKNPSELQELIMDCQEEYRNDFIGGSEEGMN